MDVLQVVDPPGDAVPDGDVLHDALLDAYRKLQELRSFLEPATEQVAFARHWAKVTEHHRQKRYVLTSLKMAHVSVFPSMVEITWPDGVTVNINVGELYDIFMAHFWQNGLWANLDFGALPADKRAMFNLGHMDNGWTLKQEPYEGRYDPAYRPVANIDKEHPK